MTFEEALKAMKEGKMVKLGNMIYRFDQDEKEFYYSSWEEVSFDSSEIMTTDWEIVK